jgi:hypothetical protein
VSGSGVCAQETVALPVSVMIVNTLKSPTARMVRIPLLCRNRYCN